MKNSLLQPLPVPLAGAVLVFAAALNSSAQDLYDPTERSGWFARADAVARFNLKASMKTLPVTAGSGIYDNGTVFPDISGTASGQTWNWSYQSASQVAYDANNLPEAIVYQRFADVPRASGQVDLDNPTLGGEVVVGFRFDDFKLGKHNARFGIEIGYGYYSSSQTMNFDASGLASLTIDSYLLHGVVPPVPPYAGTFQGPGPLLDLHPDPANSSFTEFLTSTTFRSSLDTSFHNFRFGPFFSVDLTKRLGVELGLGYQSLYASATVDYLETSAYTPTPATISVHESKWRVGFYAELLGYYQITSHLSVFVGGDFQYNDDLVFNDAYRHEFTIQLGSTYAAKGGLTYSF